MKRISILSFLVCAMLSTKAQTAKTVDEKLASKTAQAFAQTNTLKNQELTLVSSDGIYIYNIGTQGFVIISGNTVLPPVLAYSERSNFPDMADAPENFVSWIAHYSDMIDFAVANDIRPETKVQHQWEDAAEGVFGTRDAQTVAPLINTHWNQDCYYNEYCPETNGGWWDGPCGHVYAGCVACAMAQVMKYWNHPATGFGSHSYIHNEYGEQSANFAATTYDWDAMPNEIWSHNDAVATLMYHCGVSVNMNYSPSGSGAQSRDVETAMRSYFGYCGAKYCQKSDYSDENWTAMLKAELDQSRPIYYSGVNGDSGHAFVCDGYDNYDLFHFNFGWSGSGDEYYSTYDVNGFNSNQAAGTNIYPISIQADANGIIYVSEDGVGNGSSWENATNKLEFASNLSSGGGTKVWVKAGTYYGDTTDSEGAFHISSSNRVYGGFEGNEPPDYDLSQRDFEKNATILDGQGARRVLMQAQAFNAGSAALWDGFTLQNGYNGSGAGAYLNNYITLANCNIINNTGTMLGGGVYINLTGTAPHVTLQNCNITDNISSMGGGICDRLGANFINSRISNNTASAKGGGIYLYNSAQPLFKNCIISNNTAKNAGALYARGKFTAYNCNFVMNLATESIGGVFHENQHNKYYNCILWGNMVNGMPNQFSGQSDFDNCAVVGTVSGSENYDIPVENDGEEPGVFVRFSNPAEGVGADYHNENWSLNPRSICLNAGKPNTAGLGLFDIAGNPRIQKGRVEIGAYESCAALTRIEDGIYENGEYDFNGRTLTEPGYYTAVLNGPDCDSVIGLTLDIIAGTLEHSETAIQVWPNPTTDILHFETDGIENVEIRNLLGQIIMSTKKVGPIDLSNMENGVYLLIISDKQGLKSVRKIIKE